MSRIFSETTEVVKDSMEFLVDSSPKKMTTMNSWNNCVSDVPTKIKNSMLQHKSALIDNNNKCHHHQTTHTRFKEQIQFPTDTSRATLRVERVVHHKMFTWTIDLELTKFKHNGEIEQIMLGLALAQQFVEDDSYSIDEATMTRSSEEELVI